MYNPDRLLVCIGRRNGKGYIIMCNYEFLDPDETWFAIKHGMSLNKNDYTPSELLKLNNKIIKEKKKKEAKRYKFTEE